MPRSQPRGWPARPKGFYSSWQVFCSEVVAARLHDAPSDVAAALLLAAGAVLGGTGMLAIVAANAEAIDKKGKEWGIEKLSSIVGVGGALVGAAVGGLGVAWLTRTLGGRTDSAKVEREQAQLVRAKQEFEMLLAERTAGRLSLDHLKLAVERLFLSLTSS
jgi:hypothetical protein